MLDGATEQEENFQNLFTLYRKSKRGIYSITLKRGVPQVLIEYDLKNHPKLDFSKKSHVLLYGKHEEAFRVWKSLQLNKSIKYLKVDVRADFPIVSKDIPKEQ